MNIRAEQEKERAEAIESGLLSAEEAHMLPMPAIPYVSTLSLRRSATSRP